MKKSVLALTLVAATLALGLAGCSGGASGPDATITAEPGVAAGPIDTNSIDGKTLELNVGDFSEINVGKSDVTKWTAKSSTEGIVTFVPGQKEGETTWQPGISATKPGKTDVEVTNGKETFKFTVVVK